jgi:ribosomal protein S18 acetylase RimI-like enzyme
MSQELQMVSLATSGDFATIATLNVEAYLEFADRMSADSWRKMEASVSAIEARSQSTQFLVVKDAGVIVGSVGYCQEGKGNPEVFPPDWAGLVLLAVAPSYRGRGIGQALVCACIKRAQHDAAQTIGLFTSELMTAAQHLYESLGFQRDRKLPPRLDLCYWRYKLDL